MQTILGAGGAIGTELAKVLREDYTNKIRLVSRNPRRVSEEDEIMKADLTVEDDVYRAVKDSKIVYLTAGLKYSTRTWRKKWPLIMRNVMNACMDLEVKLVFIDNMYMYDRYYLDGMNERTPIKPLSRKGKIRHRVAKMLIGEMNLGNLKGLIARSGDFYGPSIKKTSLLTELVFNPLSKGKKASWLGSTKFSHSFTYVPDAAEAIAKLANTSEVYGEVWHLPTAPDPPNGEQWVELIAKEMGVEPKFRTISTFMVGLMGLVIPVMWNLREMMYQYKREYVFDSSKFENKFGIHPTPYIDGVREVIETDYAALLDRE